MIVVDPFVAFAFLYTTMEPVLPARLAPFLAQYFRVLFFCSEISFRSLFPVYLDVVPLDS